MTPQGSKAPIDCEPVSNGNILLLQPARMGGALLAVTLSDKTLEHARAQGAPLRLNHWATCPDKQEWREKTDAKQEASGAAASD
jgi:hypothetical protein